MIIITYFNNLLTRVAIESKKKKKIISSMKTFKSIFILLLFFYPLSILNAGDSYFPKIEKWSYPDTIPSYSPDNLWEIINGAADNFLRYDIQEMQLAEYTQNDDYIVVEAYHHKTPEMAFGIYTQERPLEGNFLDIGAEGYLAPGILNFLVKDYYIKIHSPLTDSATQLVMQKIARKMAAQISSHSSLPEILDKFPDPGKISKSEQFISTAYLGHKFLQKTYQAKYKSGDNSFNICLFHRTNKNQIEQILKDYYEYTEQEFSLKANNVYKVEDKYNGTIFFIWEENYLAGIVNLKDEALRKQYIDLLKEKL